MNLSKGESGSRR